MHRRRSSNSEGAREPSGHHVLRGVFLSVRAACMGRAGIPGDSVLRACIAFVVDDVC